MNIIKLQVKTNNQKYPIIIGHNIINKLKKIFKENNINFNQCLIIIDNKIPKKFVKSILRSLPKKNITTHYFKSSEVNKNQKSVDKIISILLKKNFNRNDCLISVGGGITGDVSSFASSIFKRGLNFINIPTTLLSQVDSSIGGKTGINTKFGKNLVGSFYQPRLVISDISFLKSLGKRELICGYGEILKHSLISSKKFFLYLDKNGSKLFNLKSPFIEKSIYQSCIIKKNIVQKDEKETGLRKVLNFGHTFAHAFEATLGYSKKLNHGEAVILGLKTASRFSYLNNLIKIKDFQLIENHLKKFNLPKNINRYFTKKDISKLISFMKKDKKNNTRKINLVLLKKIGLPIYNFQFNEKKISSFLKRELIN
ncbi:MAG: 3-dehydroquinate synthase [Candidatus Pelagibacter sp. TMED106]|nr:MAG: 3-dehydroquinate synthase [Candidatus Pelagibacter sp. TMED106]